MPEEPESSQRLPAGEYDDGYEKSCRQGDPSLFVRLEVVGEDSMVVNVDCPVVSYHTPNHFDGYLDRPHHRSE